MNTADFEHEILNRKGRNIIKIIDLDLGSISVTNDIENVIKSIALMEKVNPAEYMVIYQDSMAIWDGYDVESGLFVSLHSNSFDEAVDIYIDIQLKATK